MVVVAEAVDWHVLKKQSVNKGIIMMKKIGFLVQKCILQIIEGVKRRRRKEEEARNEEKTVIVLLATG